MCVTMSLVLSYSLGDCRFFGGNWVHYKDEHLMFLSRKTFNWIADHYGLYLFDIALLYKYGDLIYISCQLEHFDYKVLGDFFWINS